MDTENTERVFKGVWIPAELWDLWRKKELTSSELLLLLEIDSFTSHNKDCFISNEHIAHLLGVSKVSSSNILNSLIKKGLVKLISFDGRKRTVKSLLNTDKVSCRVKPNFKADSNDNTPELNQTLRQSKGRVEVSVKTNFNHTNNTITNTQITNINNKEINKESEDSFDDLEEDDDLPFGYTEEEKAQRRANRIKERELEKQLQNPIYEGLNLNTAMLEVINEWKAYKKERRQTYTPKGEIMFIKKLLEYSKGCVSVAKQIVENSMANNYAGIYEPKQTTTTNRTGVMLNVNDLWK